MINSFSLILNPNKVKALKEKGDLKEIFNYLGTKLESNADFKTLSESDKLDFIDKCFILYFSGKDAAMLTVMALTELESYESYQKMDRKGKIAVRNFVIGIGFSMELSEDKKTFKELDETTADALKTLKQAFPKVHRILSGKAEA